MLIKRLLSNLIKKRLNDPKAIILIGPRQVGKTTLLRQLSLKMDEPVLWWNGDEPDIRHVLSNITSTHLKNLIGKHTLLIIDEAQRIENIGMTIKLIVDNIPSVKVIATGSSAFELANRMNEPLTGRKWQYYLYPLSWEEMVTHHGLIEEGRLLNHRLIYGYYPDIVEQAGDEPALLSQLVDSYLYKDILILENIQKQDRLERLVQALAFQIGNQVSYNELGKITGLNNETVEKYISILEKAYVVFRLGAFSRNLRHELKKTRKIYFYDNGIRNAIIKYFNPVGLRDDIGALWENFLVSERIKRMANRGLSVNSYFWRTAQQQEIDYLEECDGKLFAWEFKWNNAKARFPKTFTNAYPHCETKIITPDNLDCFLLDDG
jgi:predicted AAA+ superfamily ATPase